MSEKRRRRKGAGGAEGSEGSDLSETEPDTKPTVRILISSRIF